MNRDNLKAPAANATAWERNLAALEARLPGFDCLPPRPPGPPRFQRVRLLAGEPPSLQVLGEKGRRVTLHSPRRAWEEAQELARTAPVAQSPCLVALGLGLGYHLLALLPLLAAGQRLIVVEREPEVMWAALTAVDLTPLWTHPGLTLVVTPEAGEAVRHLKEALPQGNGSAWSLWGHPPSLRCHQEYYQAVTARLRPAAPRPGRPMGLKKDRLRVLLVNPDYFLIVEVKRALQQLGHEVRLALFDKRQDRGEEVLLKVLQLVQDFSPDLVFTVNHLGFDREGHLLEALDRRRLPSVSWYVDSPAIILSLYDGPKSERAFIFVWDPTYIPDVKALGFRHVYALPLATDPDIFSPRRGRGRKKAGGEVVFVGNSMVGPVREKRGLLPQSSQFEEIFSRLLTALQAQPFRRLEALLAAAGLTAHPLLRDFSPKDRSDLEAALLWRGTLDYRLTCLKTLAPFRPVIYGDTGWRKLLGAPFRLRPEVNYYDDLPRVYGAAGLNFNATSLQMKAAVNQRVFDVPAAGGFLLTDYREQLAELFDLDKEMACFQEPGEIPELVRFYLKRSRLAEQMTVRARSRVLAEHTYRHRLAAMLSTLRRVG